MEIKPQQTELANPAAVYCGNMGGAYDLATGACVINGVAYDAWQLYNSGLTPQVDGESSISAIIGPIMELVVMLMMMGMMKSMFNPGGKGVIRQTASGVAQGVRGVGRGVKEGVRSIY